MRTTPAPHANPNLGSGVIGAHLNPVEVPNPFDEPTPTLPDTPAYLLGGYAQDDYMLPPTQILYPVEDEPRGHDVGGAPRGRTLVQSNALAVEAHSQDYGSSEVALFEAPIMRAGDDMYLTQRIEAERSVSMSRAALTRGRNSLPENNPDGPPDQGHYVMRWIDRRVPRRTIRPDMQPLRPYRAATAAQTPAPTEAQANQYTSPFDRLINARGRKLTTPQIRRLPRPEAEYAETDGTDDPQMSNPVYWDYA
jgi:hypothetical protein